MNLANTRFWRALPRIAVLALAVGALSGCVVVPLYPYHAHYGYWR